MLRKLIIAAALLILASNAFAACTNPLSIKDGSAASISMSVSSNADGFCQYNFNMAQINGVAPLMGNGATGTGSPRVTIASDNTAFSVNAIQSGTWTVQPGNTANSTPWLVTAASATAPVSTMNSASASGGLNSAISGVFDDTSPTAITENNFGFLRMSANRNAYNTIRDAAGNERGVNVTAGNALQNDLTTVAGTATATGSGVMTGGTQRIALATDSPGQITLGAAAITSSVPVIPSSQYPANNVAAAAPVTISATGTTGATTATIAAVASKTAYLCGFSIRATATAAAVGNATVTGTISGTLNFTQFSQAASTGLVPLEPPLGSLCIPASAANTAINVISAAPGTGGVVSVSAWGYYL